MAVAAIIINHLYNNELVACVPKLALTASTSIFFTHWVVNFPKLNSRLPAGDYFHTEDANVYKIITITHV
jgi:hypothetical protein